MKTSHGAEEALHCESHLLKTILTFLVLLPSAPISVAGHRQRPQRDARSSSRRSTVRTSISSAQDASNCRKGNTGNLYQKSSEPSSTIWRHKTHLIPSVGNVSANPPTAAPMRLQRPLLASTRLHSHHGGYSVQISSGPYMIFPWILIWFK